MAMCETETHTSCTPKSNARKRIPVWPESARAARCAPTSAHLRRCGTDTASAAVLLLPLGLAPPPPPPRPETRACAGLLLRAA
eukprot:570863-Rhodomonas_salina.1